MRYTKEYFKEIQLDEGEIVKSGENVGFPGYYFTNKGKIWVDSVKGFYRARTYINTCKDWKNGYERFRYYGKNTFVHIPLARLFVDGYEEGLVVDHIDGNSLNNNINNLQWITRSENISKYWKSINEEEKAYFIEKYSKGVAEGHKKGNYKDHLNKIHAERRKS